MDELADHFDDVTEEIMSREAIVLSRLGEADQVADAAAGNCRTKTDCQ